MMRSVSPVARDPARSTVAAATVRLMAMAAGRVVSAAVVVLAGIGPAVPQSPPGLPAAVVPAPSSRRLGADELDALLAPFAGAPQDMLGVVLDACRYPGDLIAAAQWLRTPEAMRGPASDAWAPTVRVLTERAPRTLDYLTQDIARTSVLGTAYQTQPNDVWLAYGRVTAARDVTAAPAAAPPPPAPQASSSSPGATGPAGPSATSAAASPPTATPPAANGVTTVVTTPPSQQPSATGAAIVGGLIGFGAGLLLSELTDNDQSSYGGGPYPPAYAAPLPYAPYAGSGYRYAATRDLQDDRQAAAAERQQSRQAFATERREDWQDWGAQEQQRPRPATDDRQANRQDDRRRVESAPLPAARSSGVRADGGAQRRSAATSSVVGAARPVAPISTPQRSAVARPAVAASAPGWGPAAGLSDGAAAARSRSPAGGGRAAAGRRQ